LAVTGRNLFNRALCCGADSPAACDILFKERWAGLQKGTPEKNALREDGMGAYLSEGAFELFEVVLSFFLQYHVFSCVSADLCSATRA
jgi:V/A-type H+-transporting ATPase subunit I